ncbi:MAG: hypothetical protein WA813_23590, partial [Beijerinckiaceae bacterium]
LPGLALGEGTGLASVVSGTASCDYPFLPEGAAKHAPTALAFHHGESEGEPFHGMRTFKKLFSACATSNLSAIPAALIWGRVGPRLSEGYHRPR